MSTPNVTVYALDGDEQGAIRVAEALRGYWPAVNPPEFRLHVGDKLPERAPEDIHAAVILPGCTAGHVAVTRLLDLLDEFAVPAILLMDQTSPERLLGFGGALVERRETAPAILASIVRGMVHRQSEVRRLHREAALAARFNGGLRGEIARMHDELQLAAMVQQEFLPRETPTVHGVQFAAMWRPTNYVSGDIYDIARLDEDRVGVFIADAVGHGVPAALLTMVICRSLPTKEIVGNSYRIVPPSEALVRLNSEMIRRQGRTTRFATAIYAVVDCRERVITIAGAGHPPPALVASDGTIRRVETQGGLLGVFPQETYPSIDVPFALGDSLVLFSDGFEQAFPDPGADAYQRRLPSEQYLNEFASLMELGDAQAMVDRMRDRIDIQTGSLHQADDVTMVVVRAGAMEAAEPAAAAAAAA